MMLFRFHRFNTYEMQDDNSINDLNFNGQRSAIVLVLGDIGRSPRMCNHAVALANVGFNVTLVGYDQGSNLNQSVKSSAKIKVAPLYPYPKILTRWLPRILGLGLKVIWQLITLCFSLPWMCFRGPDVLLMQNPPSIPTLGVSYVYAFFHPGTKLVLDWHNYGFSILQLSFNGRHILVWVAKKFEAFFGPRVHAAFCVSKAMKRDLHNKWNIDATVLYDRPMNSFRPSTLEEKHELMTRLSGLYPELGSESPITDDQGRLKPSRPGILVSSTSWTPDEDFGILFDALRLYESRCEVNPILPDLLCVITGKGPLKEYYQELIADQQWTHVKVIMPWLEPDDYPRMLGSADLGVCLHTSSSGVDLPMKVNNFEFYSLDAYYHACILLKIKPNLRA